MSFSITQYEEKLVGEVVHLPIRQRPSRGTALVPYSPPPDAETPYSMVRHWGCDTIAFFLQHEKPEEKPDLYAALVRERERRIATEAWRLSVTDA